MKDILIDFVSSGDATEAMRSESQEGTSQHGTTPRCKPSSALFNIHECLAHVV